MGHLEFKAMAQARISMKVINNWVSLYGSADLLRIVCVWEKAVYFATQIMLSILSEDGIELCKNKCVCICSLHLSFF